MAKFGKKYQDAAKLVEAGKAYDLAEAIEVVKKTATAKFDESVDVAVRLGVNPKYADQQVRGAVVLPHGTGKSKRVLVFAKGDKVRLSGFMADSSYFIDYSLILRFSSIEKAQQPAPGAGPKG